MSFPVLVYKHTGASCVDARISTEIVLKVEPGAAGQNGCPETYPRPGALVARPRVEPPAALPFTQTISM